MKRPDASMSLLADVAAEAMEPEYLTTTRPRRTRWVLPVALTLVTALMSVAVLSATRSRGELANERDDLLTRVAAEQARRDDLAATVAALDTEISQLRQASVADPSVRADLQRLELVTGATAVTGPGVEIRVDDATQLVNGKGLIYDSDLSRLVNGLWEAGAEAVAINGHRITTLTPIRSAGSAITVDYVSLEAPYVVEAIGDPDRLPGRFALTPGARWWQYIHDSYGISYDLKSVSTDLSLPADPGMALRFAQR